jgi:hypothetical protein
MESLIGFRRAGAGGVLTTSPRAGGAAEGEVKRQAAPAGVRADGGLQIAYLREASNRARRG